MGKLGMLSFVILTLVACNAPNAPSESEPNAAMTPVSAPAPAVASQPRPGQTRDEAATPELARCTGGEGEPCGGGTCCRGACVNCNRFPQLCTGCGVPCNLSQCQEGCAGNGRCDFNQGCVCF